MMDVTTPVKQEQRLLESWGRLKLLIPGENRRLFAALNYFQIACRLACCGGSSVGIYRRNYNKPGQGS